MSCLYSRAAFSVCRLSLHAVDGEWAMRMGAERCLSRISTGGRMAIWSRGKILSNELEKKLLHLCVIDVIFIFVDN